MREQIAHDKRLCRNPATRFPMGMYYYRQLRAKYSTTESIVSALNVLRDPHGAATEIVINAVVLARGSTPQRGEIWQVFDTFNNPTLMDCIGICKCLAELKPWLKGEHTKTLVKGMKYFDRVNAPASYPKIMSLMTGVFDRTLKEIVAEVMDNDLDINGWWALHRLYMFVC